MDNYTRAIPFKADGPEKTRDFLLRHFDDEHNKFRANVMTRYARSLWFKYGRQWIRPEEKKATASGYTFSDLSRKSPTPYPMPVDNHIGPGVRNLVARLGRQELEPSVPPESSSDPQLTAAARVGRDWLLYDMRQENFDDLREQLAEWLCSVGHAIGRSAWEDSDETMPASSPDAMKCGTCGTMLASPTIETTALQQATMPKPVGGGMELFHLDAAEVDRQAKTTKLTRCPTCAEPVEMGKYLPSIDEAKGGKDFFGRPLGSEQKKGKAKWGVISPFEYYPQFGGLGVDPDTCRVHGWAHVESLDWIRANIPDCEDVKKEEQEKLLKRHPLLVNSAFADKSGIAHTDVYACHAVVYELVVDAQDVGGETAEDGLRLGRYIVMVGDKIRVDEPLMFQDPKGKLVPKVKYAADRDEIVPKQYWGRSRVEDAIPLQIRLNMRDAIDDDLTQRGIPWIAIPEGCGINRHSNQTGVLNEVETYGEWSVKDNVIHSTPLNGNVFQPSREAIIQSIQRILGPTPVEIGDSGGARSGDQLRIQAEEAAQKVGPLERGLKRIYEALWSHRLDLRWTFQRFSSDYLKESAHSTYEKAAATGQDLRGQVKVKVEAKGSFDRSVIQVQGTKEAYDAGLYGAKEVVAQTPALRNQLLEQMQLPKLDDDVSIQIQRAEQAWQAFLSDGEIPVLDVTVLDTWLWYQVLGKRWLGDEAVEKQRAAGWSEVLKKLTGWERRWKAQRAQALQLYEVYGGHPPEAWEGIYAEWFSHYTKDQEAAQVTGIPGAVPMPPEYPQSGQLPPESIYDQLLALWHEMLGGNPAAITIPEGVAPVTAIADPAVQQAAKAEPLLQFYAVIQQCRLEEMEKRQKESMGAMAPAAPGGARTVDGGAPVPGEAVIPGGGTAATMAAA